MSVVVPTYDRIALLPEALDSVLAQTFGDLELLVVDDGSRDGTGEVLRGRYGHEPRLRYLPQANGGTASARNHGLRHARAGLVAFLDSDDVWFPGFLASQVARLEAEPDAALVVCDARFEGEWSGRGPTQFADRDFRAPLSMAAMMQGAWAVPSSWCLRRERVGRLRFATDYAYCEDTEFLFRLASVGARVVLNPEVLVVHRHHEAPGSPQKTRSRPEHAYHHLRLLQDYAAHAPDPRALRERLAVEARAYVPRLADQGRWAEARPLLWAWLRRRPDSTRAWRWWLRSLLG